MRLPLLIASLGLGSPLAAAGPIRLTVLHMNDLHAHLEPTMIAKKSYGGYARLATKIAESREKDKNVIVLHAGDTFQGTLYFNVFQGLADLAILNQIGLDAHTLGNHEFDLGIDALQRFAGYARFPLLAANMDARGESRLSRIAPYAIVKVGREKVGVIGVITPDTPAISNPGETVRFGDPVVAVREGVRELRSQKIDKIIVLSHLGFNEDKKLVEQVSDVDLVVGGHSHTKLGVIGADGLPPNLDTYPVMVKDRMGSAVPVVQAWEWGKVLGRIVLDFDGKGRLKKVVEASPILIDESVAEDPQVKSLVETFKIPIAATANQPVTVLETRLTREVVSGEGDSAMSRVIADAMLHATAKAGAVAAFINAGGVRSGLESGQVTYGDALSVQPFGNTLVLLDLTGEELLAALNRGAAGPGRLLPSEGTTYGIVGERVTDVVVGGAPLDLKQTYRVTLQGFVAGGGDKHSELKASLGRRLDTGFVDIDALVAFLKLSQPKNRPARITVK